MLSSANRFAQKSDGHGWRLGGPRSEEVDVDTDLLNTLAGVGAVRAVVGCIVPFVETDGADSCTGP